MAATAQDRETARVSELHRYGILDTEGEERFDRIARLARRLTQVPICLVTLVDKERLWFKSHVGLELREAPRSGSFCEQTIMGRDVLVIQDASKDERFQSHPHVAGGMKIRFYAGAPLITPNDHILGSLCLIDTKPRTLSDDQIEVLRELAAIVIDEMRLDLTVGNLKKQKQKQGLVTRELERRNEELELFAYVASHDLQEPMRTISCYVELLEKSCAEHLDEAANRHLQYIAQGSRRMHTLVDDLLDYVEAAKLTAPTTPVDLTQVFEEAAGQLRHLRSSEAAQLSADPLPRVPGYPTLLKQLFINLLSNALKFRSAAPPVVHISATEGAGQWTIAVQDNGIGLDPKFADRIFKPFQRLHLREEYGGNGIGLAIASKVVQQHNGRIWVESSPGAGATFYFTLSK